MFWNCHRKPGDNWSPGAAFFRDLLPTQRPSAEDLENTAERYFSTHSLLLQTFFLFLPFFFAPALCFSLSLSLSSRSVSGLAFSLHHTSNCLAALLYLTGYCFSVLAQYVQTEHGSRYLASVETEEGRAFLLQNEPDPYDPLPQEHRLALSTHLEEQYGTPGGERWRECLGDILSLDIAACTPFS